MLEKTALWILHCKWGRSEGNGKEKEKEGKKKIMKLLLSYTRASLRFCCFGVCAINKNDKIDDKVDPEVSFFFLSISLATS